MCLIVNSAIHSGSVCNYKPFLATHDIIVKKLLIKLPPKRRTFWEWLKRVPKNISPRYRSPFRGTEYKLNELHEATGRNVMHQALSYRPPAHPDTALVDIYRTVISEGVHAYVHNKTWATKRHSNEVLMTAYIPKGNNYFLGTDGDIVSSSLFVTDREFKATE